ncbi:hypothetical protein D9611_012884 [Ephemerocybe angulata]|uniref:Protein kinase domain-containing protein n=1 Tax=Ephemerocybe angulata TaxID=980116 RepID=A0A8H5BAT1_9AGAR|nr:hypothetical protein D9611_012884 [Tulosesus angulatus]
MNLFHSTVKEENKSKVFMDCLLEEDEERWVQNYHFLLQRGYALRPRYHPDWVPSWQGLDVNALDYPPEDSIQAYPGLVDAIRVADGKKVVLKHIPTASEELSISIFVSSPPQTKDLRNHCVPLLDVILIPACETHVLIVMPLLYENNKLPFRHAGELLEIAIQLTEGALIRGILPRLPMGDEKASKEVRSGVAGGVRLLGIYGQDTSVPEMSLTEPYDPFPVDVYHLGNVLLHYYNNYEPDETIDKLRSVAQKMIEADPTMRPTAEEVAREVHSLSQDIGYFSRSRRVWPLRGYGTLLRWLIRLGVLNPM